MSDASVLRCPQCGQENPPEARFCMRCGTALTRRCPACGAANPLDAQFCFRCGTPLAGAAAPERRLLSVLFADLAGSTELISQIDPEPARALFGEYFAAMREEIERHGGVVEKFIGDAVMAVFGLPIAHEDDADRSVRAALAMQRRMAGINARAGRPLELLLRVGIATGEVIADPSAVSSGQSMVTGEAVNLAFRLQESAPPGGIVVDERTLLALRVHGEFKPLPPGEGDFAALPRWQVVQIADGVPGKRLRAPLIGRDEELRFLRALYRRAVDSRRQHLITVIGSAGVGKTRLMEEFVRSLAAEATAVRVLRGRCPSYGGGLTYWPLAEMIKQECHIRDDDPPEAMLTKLREAVDRICTPVLSSEQSATIATDLATLLGVAVGRPYEAMWRDRLAALKQVVESRPSASDTPAAGERGRGKDVLIPSVRSFFVALAQQQPVVLVFEDLHWAQESLLDLLERVAVRGPDVPILTVCLARPELLDRRPDWGARLPSHTTLSLQPLSAEHSRTLISELLKDPELPDDVRTAVTGRAEGNPFFIEEILRRLIDGGDLVRGTSGWRLASPGGEIRIPDTIHGILASRLDLLLPPERQVIQDAAVVGRVFWLNALKAAGDLDPKDAEAALDRLQDRDLIEERAPSVQSEQREFAFKHALIREVAYSLLPKTARSTRHLRLAEWLEQTAGTQIDNLLELRAFHYEQAWRAIFDTGDVAEDLARRAIAALRQAAERATQLRTLPEARRLFERALAIVHNAGLTRDLPLYLEVLVEHSDVVKWMSLPDAVFEDTDVVLKEAPRIGRDDLVARAWLNRGHAESDKVRLEAAEQALRTALDLFRRRGDKRGEVETLEILGGVTSDLRGSLQKAEEAYRRVIELYREMGDFQGTARTMGWLGRAILSQGRLSEARAVLTEAADLARAHSERISEATCLMGLAILAHLEGRTEESEALHGQVIALVQALGDPFSEGATRRHLGAHYLRHGKLSEAEEQLHLAMRARTQAGAKPESSQILRTWAELALARGELLGAADYAERALKLVLEQDAVAIATHQATLGKVRAAQGRGEDAEDLFRSSLEVLEQREYRIDLALTLMKHGEALWLLAQEAYGRKQLERARDEFAAMGAGLFVREIDRALAAHPKDSFVRR